MKAEDLLGIDAESELRRVVDEAVDGPWQAPTELARRALAAGAGQVEVAIGRGYLRVRDDGRAPDPAHVEAAQRLVSERDPAARHRALVALDAAPELRMVAALRPRSVTIETAARATIVTVRGARFDPAASRRWLQACARFAPAVILLDGRPLARGFREGMAERALGGDLEGRVALTADETATVWLLAHGIVSSRLTLPDAPGFEAAVELAGAASGTEAAALREAAAPRTAGIVETAVALALDVARAPQTQQPVRRLLLPRLLAAARRGFRRSEILEAPLLDVRGGRDGARGRLRLADLQAGRCYPCLEPEEDPASFRMPEGPVLVLGAVERELLAALLGLSFRSLGRRRLDPSLVSRARRRLDAWRQAAVAAVARVAGDPAPAGAARARQDGAPWVEAAVQALRGESDA